MTTMLARLWAARIRIFFGLLVVGVTLMLLKTLAYLHAPHQVMVGIDAFCLALAAAGLATCPLEPARPRLVGRHGKPAVTDTRPDSGDAE